MAKLVVMGPVKYHPRRRIVRDDRAVLDADGNRGCTYELECGHVLQNDIGTTTGGEVACPYCPAVDGEGWVEYEVGDK